MTRLTSVLNRVRSMFHRDELDDRMDEEIAFHIEFETARNVKAGMTLAEARRQAMVRFGGVERTRERTRDQVRVRPVESFIRDCRYGWRALLHAPAFTTIAILTLALGIGATTVMFSIVNGVVLRPLPYPDQDRLIELVHEAPGIGIDELFASPAVYFGYRDHSRTFESVGMWDWDRSPVTITGSGDPESVESIEVTHDVLSILGATPVIGRAFDANDDVPGSAPTAIISHAYWQRRFGGANPLGETLVVNGVPRQVIGVMPQWFRFFDRPADIFYPLQLDRAEAVFPSGDGRGLARLRVGVTLAQANADIVRMIPILNDEFGVMGAQFEMLRFAPKLRWLKDSVVGNLGDTLWLLMGTIGVLLLIACANVSNLVLVRTQARRSELATRAALGAGMGGIVRVVFAESAILGIVGGAVGVVAAYFALPLVLSMGAADLPWIMTVGVDGTVLLVALGTSVLAVVMFALIPVFNLGGPRFEIADVLRAGARSVTQGRRESRSRHALLVVQVALALVLLIGSGLMIRTFVTLRQVDPGFSDPAGIQTFQLTIPTVIVADAERPAVQDAARTIALQRAIADRLAAIPGVASAAFTSSNDGLPLDGDGYSSPLIVEGRTEVDDERVLKETQFASPRFFETMGTRVIAGRTFEWSDIRDTATVAIVSENLARAEWGSASAALGRRIGPGSSGPWREIVGVVGDVHHDGMAKAAPELLIYPSFARNTTASFVIRSDRAGTMTFLNDVRRAVWSVNGTLSIANVRTIDDMYRRSMGRTSMTLRLLAITGALALVMGLVGISGVVSYAISRRRREIGVRLALGAKPAEVRAMFVRQAVALAGTGVVIGLGVAMALTRLMTTQLFGISPLDPLTYIAVALVLMGAAGVASYMAAAPASATDPVEVLKGD